MIKLLWKRGTQMEELKTILNQIYQKGLYLIIAILFIYIGFKLTNYYIKHLKKNKFIKTEPTIKNFIISILNIIIKGLIIVIAASIVGIPTTTFFTIIGSCGLAIGLALQGGLSNLAGGIMLIIFKPFKEGDYIEANGKEGKVNNINIFYTTLTTPDNKEISMPNGTLSNSNITNYTHNPIRRLDIEISVSYNSKISKVKDIINKILEKSEYTLKDKENTVRLINHGDSALIFTVKTWVNNEEYWNAKFNLLEEIKEEFDKNKIEIPYPQLDIHQK